MRKTLAAIAAVMLLLLIAGMGAALWSYNWLHSELPLQQPAVYELPRGASLRAVAHDLHRRGILDHPQVWIAAGRIIGKAGALKAGEYRLEPGLTPLGALHLLSSGHVVLHAITFIEGSRFVDMLAQLKAHEAVRLDYVHRSPEDIMAALGQPGVHPEGMFFPDTYRFARHTSDLEILRMALQRMAIELEKAWENRSPDLPLSDPYEALILASIVEKETALDRERPLVAGVFIERLRRGMRLQTDPTVIYGIGESFDGNIRRVDLRRDTPYNTYTRSGLPPTPIALPGLDSLNAAVRPEMSGKIFFVATGEPDGSHFFSSTLAEHEAAVRRYLKRLRQRE